MPVFVEGDICWVRFESILWPATARSAPRRPLSLTEVLLRHGFSTGSRCHERSLSICPLRWQVLSEKKPLKEGKVKARVAPLYCGLPPVARGASLCGSRGRVRMPKGRRLSVATSVSLVVCPCRFCSLDSEVTLSLLCRLCPSPGWGMSRT